MGPLVLNALFSCNPRLAGGREEVSIECLQHLLLQLHHSELVMKIFKETDFE